MSSKRFLCPWVGSETKPAIYHCVSRVVDRRFVLGDEERECFRMFMRMYEKFSGCRVLSYCVMSNHFHILLEVPPKREDFSLSDGELLERLHCINGKVFVATVGQELARARADDNEEWAAEIHARFTYRMYDLSEFMKTVLQRFTRWFNRKHERSGTLWEARYTSVIVESGIAARTMAAYIDLNPVRAGMVSDPADYRWCSYGEAVGGGKKGNGKKAREGLVRACLFHKDGGFDAGKWKEVASIYRRLMGMALERKPSLSKVQTSYAGAAPDGSAVGIDGTAGMNDAEFLGSGGSGSALLPELSMAKMLRCRVRYFTDGAVIGSKEFVNEAFAAARERFSERRKDGARKLRGTGAAAAGTLWSIRDLRVRIG